jgi:hypothetical protein
MELLTTPKIPGQISQHQDFTSFRLYGEKRPVKPPNIPVRQLSLIWRDSETDSFAHATELAAKRSQVELSCARKVEVTE